MGWEEILKSNGLGQKVMSLPDAETYLKVLWGISNNMIAILDNSWHKIDPEDKTEGWPFNWFSIADDNLASEAIKAALNDYESGGYDYSNMDPNHQFVQFMDGLKALV